MTVGPTHVTIRVFMDDSDDPQESVDLPVPVAPEKTYPGGGGWKWVGPLPQETVDLGNGYSLRLHLTKTVKGNGGTRPDFREPGENPAEGEPKEPAEEPESPEEMTEVQMIETNINWVLGKGLSYAKTHQITGSDYDSIREWTRVARRFLGLPLPKQGMTLAQKRVERETWERTSPRVRKALAEGLVSREHNETESLPA